MPALLPGRRESQPFRIINPVFGLGRGFSIGLFAAVVALPTAPFAAADRAPEYNVKAAYLFNLANFTDWPASVFTAPTAPFKVCVAVPDPFRGALARAFADEQIGGHPAVVAPVRTVTNLDGCQMLFIGEDADGNGGLIRAAAAAPILTVGETGAFSRRGGIITFFLDAGKVRFEANPRAAERAGVHLSSKVLQVAAHRDQP